MDKMLQIATELADRSREYTLRAGEYVRDGVLYGWTGGECSACHGDGRSADNDAYGACQACAGTGEEHGRMPEQPDNLGRDTE